MKKMKTGSELKGKHQKAPGGHRSGNHESMDVSRQHLKGKAESPTQGRTRNHPSVAPIPKAKPGSPTAHTYFANSRTAVHPHFDRHPHD